MLSDEFDRLRLLVVDDEPDNLDLLHRTFRRDFQVYKARSGAEALQLLEEQGEMAIIISDQRMPHMNGTDFLSRTVDWFPDTIRIVLTGYTDVEDLVDAINDGKVFKYITKPWMPQDLRAVIRQAAETYKVLKQRTHTLTRALQRESLFNAVMTAIRGSLDYTSMLQTVVETLGKTFGADCAVLYPAEVLQSGGQNLLTEEVFTYCRDPGPDSLQAQIKDRDLLAEMPTHSAPAKVVSDTIHSQSRPIARLRAPFIYQNDTLAVINLYQQGSGGGWSQGTPELLKSVSEQVALAISQAKLYQQSQRQTEQMRAELEVARQIQNNLLHQSWPDISGIQIQARCHPAREVGGDFYEVFVHPQGDIWLAVGDVSGKGVPAALFMASAISVLRRELSQENSPSPEAVMRNLNQSLSEDLVSNNCFITMALVRYRPSECQMVYANAGHVYPLVWSHQAILEQRPASPLYLETRGVPLGILPDWQATAGELKLESGDRVLLTSDGITEATVALPDDLSDKLSEPSNAQMMLKQEGLWQLLQRQPVELCLDSLLSEIRSADGEQEDDQTLLLLEVIS
ncbi:MAG: SpoIIE family protein phosphatase [Cyanobacteria bacterium P01_A01_bin.114]